MKQSLKQGVEAATICQKGKQPLSNMQVKVKHEALLEAWYMELQPWLVLDTQVRVLMEE